MNETRLALGKLWHEYFEREKVNPRQDKITKDHPYIKEYLASLPKEEVKPEPKKKGKKVK